MQVQDHIETATGFLATAGREFAAGDVLQGSGKLWDAAAHALLTVVLERGWPSNNHQALRQAVQRLTEEYGDPAIERGFLAAEKFHRNFYHRFMEEFEYPVDRPLVHDFVARLELIHNPPQE
jgi:hypothetical protein